MPVATFTGGIMATGGADPLVLFRYFAAKTWRDRIVYL